MCGENRFQALQCVCVCVCVCVCSGHISSHARMDRCILFDSHIYHIHTHTHTHTRTRYGAVLPKKRIHYDFCGVHTNLPLLKDLLECARVVVGVAVCQDDACVCVCVYVCVYVGVCVCVCMCVYRYRMLVYVYVSSYTRVCVCA
jgi:hypothetical protein